MRTTFTLHNSPKQIGVYSDYATLFLGTHGIKAEHLNIATHDCQVNTGNYAFRMPCIDRQATMYGINEW